MLLIGIITCTFFHKMITLRVLWWHVSSKWD